MILDPKDDPVYKSLAIIRQHLKINNYSDAALVVGWSMMRMQSDFVAAKLVEVINRRRDGNG